MSKATIVCQRLPTVVATVVLQAAKVCHHAEEKKKFWLDVFCGTVPKVKRVKH